MRKAVFGVVFSVWAAVGVAGDFNYDSPVTIEGILTSGTADPSITADEKPHKFPALQLSAPISVVCAPEDKECQPESGISLLHLVLKQDQMDFFKKHKGSHVILSGELFHSDNANHYTSVLLDVKSVN